MKDQWQYGISIQNSVPSEQFLFETTLCKLTNINNLILTIHSLLAEYTTNLAEPWPTLQQR